MTTLCETFPTEAAAREAADTLRARGVPAQDIGVLVGPHYHDVRSERAGGFGGPVDPEAPVGKFAGPPRRRWQAAGGFTGSRDDERQGSFADAATTLIITHDRAGNRVRAGGDAAARRVLTNAHVPEDVAGHMVQELHEGHAVLCAEVAEIDPGSARALIHQLAEAA